MTFAGFTVEKQSKCYFNHQQAKSSKLKKHFTKYKYNLLSVSKQEIA